MGIISSAKFSLLNKILSQNIYDKIIDHIRELNLSFNLNKFFKRKEINLIVRYMKSDKKNNNKRINLILIKNFGKIILNKRFNEKQIKNFLKSELNN